MHWALPPLTIQVALMTLGIGMLVLIARRYHRRSSRQAAESCGSHLFVAVGIDIPDR